MTTAAMREQLIQYLTSAEDKKVEALYVLLEDRLSEDTLNAEQWSVVEEERGRYLKGEGTSYSWEEAKKIIRKD